MSEYDELVEGFGVKGVPPEDAVPASTPEVLREAAQSVERLASEPLDLPAPIPYSEPDDETPPDLPGDPVWEQAERDRLGYSKTEKRTKAARDAAAEKMKASLPSVEEALALPRLQAMKAYEEGREARMAPIRKAFAEAAAKKAEKKR